MRPSPLPRFLLVVLACAATAAAHAPANGGTHSSCSAIRALTEAETGSLHLCQWAESGELRDLRWPNFNSYRDQVRQFYAPSFAFAWTANGVPTPQAQSLIQEFQRAEQKGLEPEDYDASHWAERLARFSTGAPLTPDELARFDLALTVSTLRYVSHLNHGRLNPSDFQMGVKRSPFDAAGFLKREIVGASDVPLALEQAEPAWPQYRRTLKALEYYLLLAGSGEGDPVPRPKDNLFPTNTYSGVLQLAARLRRTGDLPPDAKIPDPKIFEEPLVTAFKRFETRNGVDPDGILGANSYAKLTTSFAQRATQLKLALERWRWLPYQPATPLVMVNIPEFRLRAYEGDRQALAMKVIIGAASGKRTPVFTDRIESLTFRPYWNIPPHLQKDEIVPELRQDAHYLYKNHMEVVNASGHVVTNDAVTPAVLQQLDSGKLAVRQQPGDGNVLGLVKFVFPNRDGIYLHGTYDTDLFSAYRRDFSHGCIRVEHPSALASWVLRNYPEWTPVKVENAMVGDQSITVKLNSALPLLVIYNTAIVEENGDVRFSDDIYGLDAAMEKALAAARP
ncbi:MAG TPA: L,D-transpeptidase family protein [Candidatus Angelobacter sp.]|nr:L,D-transpeptidase family protein [Candidatus Angelobacter sp.]